MAPNNTSSSTATVTVEPAPITPPSTTRSLHRGCGGGANAGNRRAGSAAKRKLAFSSPAAAPPAASSPSSARRQQQKLPAVMRVSDCRPGTPRFIGGLEEAALCLVFLLLCAPVTWSFALDFVFLGLGRQDLHIAIWGFFISYWVLLGLGLIPHFRKPVRWLLDSWFLKVRCCVGWWGSRDD
jgi:hypothetical protein